jgi:hypothetical protein
MRVHFGEFAVDRDSRQLWRGQEELCLVPKAFDLLELGRVRMTFNVLAGAASTQSDLEP